MDKKVIYNFSGERRKNKDNGNKKSTVKFNRIYIDKTGLIRIEFNQDLLIPDFI